MCFQIPDISHKAPENAVFFIPSFACSRNRRRLSLGLFKATAHTCHISCWQIREGRAVHKSASKAMKNS